MLWERGPLVWKIIEIGFTQNDHFFRCSLSGWIFHSCHKTLYNILDLSVILNAVHEQTAILCMIFVGTAKQQMGSLHAEGPIIQTPPCNDFFSAGIAPTTVAVLAAVEHH
jgi:hypothetical protein